LYGESVGIIKMLRTLSTVEGHLKKSTELDPRYAEGGGYRILGIINQKVPGILGGSREEAIKYLEKAIAAVPKEPMNYLFLAKLLAEEEEDLEKAMALTSKGLKFPIPPTDYVESREARVELEKLHQELRKKTDEKIKS
jgi:tetratricopeptide (TPR) repeat protein